LKGRGPQSNSRSLTGMNSIMLLKFSDGWIIIYLRMLDQLRWLFSIEWYKRISKSVKHFSQDP
jgi:hypothetical protein